MVSRIRVSRTLAAGCLIALFASMADAAGVLRCNGRIIDRGVSLGYVLAQCGEPQVHTTQEVPVRARNPRGFSFTTGVATTDLLIYDRGYGRFPAELEFVHGRLRHIEFLYRQR